MTTYNFERRQVLAHQLSLATATVLVIYSMEGVPANSTLEPLIRTRICLRHSWHLAMKTGVENRELGHVSQKIRDSPHPLELRLNVQRGKLRQSGKSRVHIVTDQNGIVEIGTTVNHTVTHGADLSRASNAARFTAP